jgi:hypothetical protein
MGVGGSCEPLDGCKMHPCSPNAACVDQDGATDGRSCTCNMGYTGDGETCVDVDACTTAPCGEHASCEDKPAPARETVDGRTCSCHLGYQHDGGLGGGGCVEINACAASPCSPHASCIDRPPPFDGSLAGRICTCIEPFGGDGETCGCDQEGYVPKDGACADADACATSPCTFAFATCADKPPPSPNSAAGRSCGCVAPFVLSGDGDACVCPAGQQNEDGSCREVDACAAAPCHEYASCSDKPAPAPVSAAGRVCTCKPGFEGDGEACGCPTGTIVENGVCQDIDACYLAPCPARATCTDKPGMRGDASGRSCACSSPFAMNAAGDGCECPAGQSHADGSCQNTDACLNFPCAASQTCVDAPAPAADSAAGRSCVDADACVSAPCDLTATCKDLPGMPSDRTGRVCTCKTGFKGPIDGDTFCLPWELFQPTTPAGFTTTSTTPAAAAAKSGDPAVKVGIVVVAVVVLNVILSAYLFTRSRGGGGGGSTHPAAFNNPLYDMSGGGGGGAHGTVGGVDPTAGDAGYMDVSADSSSAA